MSFFINEKFPVDFIFSGRDNSDQLVRIVKVLGTEDLITYLDKVTTTFDAPTRAKTNYGSLFLVRYRFRIFLRSTFE